MTLFAVASAHGSPGATTVAMGLGAAWQQVTGRVPLVVEADPDGGVLASRFRDLRADRTLADVAVGVRRGFDLEGVLRAARPVWGGVPVVVAPPSAEQTVSALVAAGDRLAMGLAAANAEVLVDVGRLTVRSPALGLARRAVVTALVARPTFEDVAALEPRVAELSGQGCEVWLVLVGSGAYDPAEVASAVGAPLLGALPFEPRVAGMLSGGPGGEGRLRRSGLWRSLGELAGRLAGRPLPARKTTKAALAEDGATLASRGPVGDGSAAGEGGAR